jgi:hypothetical protein
MSCFDIPGLLAFCCARQSFICTLFSALALLRSSVLCEDEDDGEAGYWLDGIVSDGGVDWGVVCAAAMPATAIAITANVPDIRFTAYSCCAVEKFQDKRGGRPAASPDDPERPSVMAYGRAQGRFFGALRYQTRLSWSITAAIPLRSLERAGSARRAAG